MAKTESGIYVNAVMYNCGQADITLIRYISAMQLRILATGRGIWYIYVCACAGIHSRKKGE